MVNWRLALVMLLSSASAAGAADADCRSELLSASSRTVPANRTIEPTDLARLRDFGKQDNGLGGDAPFNLSPDGKSAALVLRRGDPEEDHYCIGVVVVPIEGSGKARLADVGGDFILAVSDVRGIPDLPIGNAEPVTPQWSPDGLSLAYLRRDRGLTRVWVARADGSGARAISRLGVNARDVRWSEDGRSLVVTTRPGIVARESQIVAEERQGFLYDSRFWTLSRSRPAPPLPIEFLEQRIDPSDGAAIGPANPPKRTAARPAGAIAFARSPKGAVAWTAPRVPGVLLGPVALHVEIAGKTFVCASPYCSAGIGALWWGSGEELFLVQGGTPENGGVTRLSRWRVGVEKTPKLMLSTLDALFGCVPAAETIVCARETATRPRHLVRIDPTSGKVTTIYDPNPEFAGLKKGTVRRLRWQLADGIGAYGDLVLPPGHRAGMRHPLVIVQYQSRGFLRGGTGDEYPIQALAGRGFAVLSVERTRPVGAGVATSGEQLMRMSTAGFAERRRVLSSLEMGVRQAISLGVVDPQRIGITGLSDGAATVQHALVNSKLFRAAAISSCCDEPSSSMFAAGPAYADFLISAGFPAPGESGSEFWGQYSLAANASRLRSPILMQLTDDEFRFALETFATLKAHDVPVEMYVFADEYHQKWRPAHRLATYERAIDWFDFWLNGRTDPHPRKQAQFDRWQELARLQSR